MNKQGVKYLLLVVGIVFGAVAVFQARVGTRLAFYDSPQSTNVLVQEVIALAQTNQGLEESLAELESQDKNIKLNLGDKTKLDEEMQAKKNKLAIINGVTAIYGPGLSLEVGGNFSTADLVDLINAIRNIGFEGMSINSVRFVLGMSISVNNNKVLVGAKSADKPLTIEIIGDPELIKTSLERNGGILEQIGQSPDTKVRIEKKDRIELSPILQ